MCLVNFFLDKKDNFLGSIVQFHTPDQTVIFWVYVFKFVQVTKVYTKSLQATVTCDRKKVCLPSFWLLRLKLNSNRNSRKKNF